MYKSINVENVVAIVFASTILLLSISPNLIAYVSFIPFLVLSIINFNKLKKEHLLHRILLVFYFAIIFSYINYAFRGLEKEAFGNIFKALFLFSPFLFTFSFIKEKNYYINKTQNTIFVCFSLALFLCAIQIYTNTLIKYLPTTISNDSLDYGHLPIYTEINNFVNGLVVLVWLFLFFSIDKKFKYFSFLVFSSLILIIFCTKSSSAMLAIISSSVLFLCFYLFKEKTALLLKLIILFSIISVFVFPTIIIDKRGSLPFIESLISNMGNSSLHRIDIWDRSTELIKERPIAGFGASSSENLPKSNKNTFYKKTISRDHFNYPHNIFLEITLELGIIGLFLLLYIINFLIDSISRMNIRIQAYAYASFCSALTIYMISMPLWRSWWIVFISFLGICFKVIDSALNSKT